MIVPPWGRGLGTDSISVADSIVSPAVWYSLTETSGTSCADTLGNGSVGTITGTTTNLHDNPPWWKTGGTFGTGDNDVSFKGDAYIDSLFKLSNLGDGIIIMVIDYRTPDATGTNVLQSWGEVRAGYIKFNQVIRVAAPNTIFRTALDINQSAVNNDTAAGSVVVDTRYSCMSAIDGLNQTLRTWLNGTETTPASISALMATATEAIDTATAADKGFHLFNHNGGSFVTPDDLLKSSFIMRMATHPGETTLADIAQGFYDNENALPPILRGL